MAYTPTQWVNGQPPALNAENLNNIENGITNVTDVTEEVAAATTVDVSVTTREAINETLTWTSGYVDQNGYVRANATYVYSSKLSVKAGDVIKKVSHAETIRFVAAYNGETAVPSAGVSTSANSYTVPEGIDGVIITINADKSATEWIYTRTRKENMYANVIPAIQTTSAEITKTIVSEYNLLDFTAIAPGKYVNTQGTLNDNPSYNATDYIKVEADKAYSFIADGHVETINQAAFYDSDKQFVPGSFQTYVNKLTIPESVEFVRFSSTNLQQAKSPMFTEGEVALPYKEYSEKRTKTIINQNAALSLRTIPYGKRYNIGDLSGTYEADLQMNNMAEYGLILKGDITSVTDVFVGKGKGVTYGMYAKVTSTKIEVYQAENTTPVYSENHGMTLKDYICICVNAKNNGTADITLMTNGGRYSKTNIRWDARLSTISAGVTGGTMKNCELSYYCHGLDRSTWIYGDSYLSLIDVNRWSTHLLNVAQPDYMLDGYGGRNSQIALISFVSALEYNIPKRLLWCLGMNNPDTSSAVNDAWKSTYETVRQYCEAYDIELILATIPNTPTNNNTYKNAIVKDSGYRYIDFASAVGASQQGSSWYDNMLSSDNVHPLEAGAIALCAQALADVPELL